MNQEDFNILQQEFENSVAECSNLNIKLTELKEDYSILEYKYSQSIIDNLETVKVEQSGIDKAIWFADEGELSYIRLRDGWKPESHNYSAYDLVVREYRKIKSYLQSIKQLQ